MNLITVVLLSVFALVVVAVLGCLVAFWKQILANRALRVGLAVLALPVILFCGFGYLASFEGGDAVFVAFRIGYAAIAAILVGVAGFLVIGRLRPLETQSIS